MLQATKRVPLPPTRKMLEEAINEMWEMLDQDTHVCGTSNSDINAIKAAEWNSLSRNERLAKIEEYTQKLSTAL